MDIEIRESRFSEYVYKEDRRVNAQWIIEWIPLYKVFVDGKRVDAFLTKTNAKRYVKRLKERIND